MSANLALKSRTAAKEFRREQLIKSTIDSIAKRGFAETTLAKVAEGAGLSQGIVNLHFRSKEILLVETLRHLAEEYKSAWTDALEQAGADPAVRLKALIDLDFDPRVCNRKKIAVWCAFWGEAKSRPTYLKLCEDLDREYVDVVRDLAQQLITDGGYDKIDVDIVANGITALVDGLWLNLLLQPQQFKRADARRTCLNYLAALFPNHIAITG
ncbi:MAG: transcriptional regulator BetI [Gammaproteobacteria bacterium]|nr:transcriptional regulator BetI [Gammaproteobacteria bacterium]